MKTEFHGLSLGDNQKAYIQEKIATITRHLGHLADESSLLRVDVTHEPTKSQKEKEAMIVKFTLTLPGKNPLRAEEHKGTMEEAVDLAEADLLKQIERLK